MSDPLTGHARFPRADLDRVLVAEWTPTTGSRHRVSLTGAQYELLARARTAILEGEGGTLADPTLTDARVVELVLAEFLSGV